MSPIRLFLLSLLTLLVLATPAAAAPSQESWFQDDDELLYSPPAEVSATLDQLASLGVDRLRLTLLWKAIAPAADVRTKPRGFDGGNPATYPPGTFDRYDHVVAEAARRGIGVSFNVTTPAPLWATKAPPREDIADTYEPDPAEFGLFVRALGARYASTVSAWSIVNEPNQPGWLSPQWTSDDVGAIERSPVLYRALLDEAWRALQETGNGADSILIGDLAPKGFSQTGVKKVMTPLRFLRKLYCLDQRDRRMKPGPIFDAQDCGGDFVTRHPALFAASALGYHPYELVRAPTVRPSLADDANIGTLSRVTRTIDRAQRAYGSRRKLPLELNEYGVQTKPDPNGFSLARQQLYLDQSEYIAYRNPRVRSLSQFLLVDTQSIDNGFQTGLVLASGKRKPAYSSYRLPTWQVRRKGSRTTVWALLRTSPNDRSTKLATVERRFGKRFKKVGTLKTTSLRGYGTKVVRAPKSAVLRVRYTAPNGVTATSRLLRVR